MSVELKTHPSWPDADVHLLVSSALAVLDRHGCTGQARILAFDCGPAVPDLDHDKSRSGQIMQAASLLKTHPRPTDQDIDQVMQGNICRCGAYPNIVAAIEQAMGAMGSKP